MQQIQRIASVIDEIDAGFRNIDQSKERAAAGRRAASVTDQLFSYLSSMRIELDDEAIAAVDSEDMAVGGDGQAEALVERTTGWRRACFK
jgi:hypothetical protein